jgi:hypothetical protein
MVKVRVDIRGGHDIAAHRSSLIICLLTFLYQKDSKLRAGCYRGVDCLSVIFGDVFRERPTPPPSIVIIWCEMLRAKRITFAVPDAEGLVDFDLNATVHRQTLQFGAFSNEVDRLRPPP